MAKDHEVFPTQIAEWLIQRHRGRAVAALTDLVEEVMARRNAETEVGRINAMTDKRLAYRKFAMDKMDKLRADVFEVCELWEDLVEGRVPLYGCPPLGPPRFVPPPRSRNNG